MVHTDVHHQSTAQQANAQLGSRNVGGTPWVSALL